jgi:hypothetical protein
MVAFPFSTEEWGRVQEAARAVLNATLAEDFALRRSHFEELRTVLAALRAKYGDHSVLLETEADFSDDPAEQVELYREAVRQAPRAGLATCSARIALARLLLEDFGEPGQAFAELMACESELRAHADEAERREWAELVVRCESRRR